MLRGSSDYLHSKEDITQGDPLSMFIYAVATLPLIHSLQDHSQIWYADDPLVAAALSNLYDWFSLLCT